MSRKAQSNMRRTLVLGISLAHVPLSVVLLMNTAHSGNTLSVIKTPRSGWQILFQLLKYPSLALRICLPAELGVRSS